MASAVGGLQGLTGCRAYPEEYIGRLALELTDGFRGTFGAEMVER